MAALIELRDNLRGFYVKNEDFMVPLMKFVLMLAAFTMINSKLGFMAQLDSIIIVLIAALLCSFMPNGFALFLSAAFILLHLYKISMECTVVAFALLLVVFLLYIGFAPQNTLLLILTPVLFALKIPYIAPIAVGLLAAPAAGVSVACGVVIYYIIDYMSKNAQNFASADAESMLTRIKEILEGIVGNRAMILMAVAFLFTSILVFIVRRMQIRYAWSVAILAGTLANVLILLIGDLAFSAKVSVLGLLFGSLVCCGLGFGVQFFCMMLDYSRTEKVQFEDDEYYYYVTAVPKMAVSASQRKVKKIASKGKKQSVKHSKPKSSSRD